MYLLVGENNLWDFKRLSSNPIHDGGAYVTQVIMDNTAEGNNPRQNDPEPFAWTKDKYVWIGLLFTCLLAISFFGVHIPFYIEKIHPKAPHTETFTAQEIVNCDGTVTPPRVISNGICQLKTCAGTALITNCTYTGAPPRVSFEDNLDNIILSLTVAAALSLFITGYFIVFLPVLWEVTHTWRGSEERFIRWSYYKNIIDVCGAFGAVIFALKLSDPILRAHVVIIMGAILQSVNCVAAIFHKKREPRVQDILTSMSALIFGLSQAISFELSATIGFLVAVTVQFIIVRRYERARRPACTISITSFWMLGITLIVSLFLLYTVMLSWHGALRFEFRFYKN